MANKLIKLKTLIPAVEGRPYRPAQPERVEYVSKRVCGYKDAHWEWDIPDDVAAIVGQGGDVIALRERLGGRWVDSKGRTVTYSCWSESTKVVYPAIPAQKGITAVPARTDYRLGWNAGARSEGFVVGDGKVSFNAGAANVGTICGLTGYESTLNVTGATIQFGWYFRNGYAVVMERFVIKTGTYAYDNNTVFRVQRAGRTITYWADDVLVYTSERKDSTEPLWLHAVMYAGDDHVFNPAFAPADVGTVVGELHLALPPVHAVVSDAAIARLLFRKLAQPVFALGLPLGSGVLKLRIPASHLHAGSGTGALLRLKAPQPAYRMNLGGLGAPKFAYLDLWLPSPAKALYGLTGAVGELNLSLPALPASISDRPIGKVKLPIPGIWMAARNWPINELPFDASALVLASNSRMFGLVSLPTRPMKAALSWAVAPYAEVTLSSASMTLTVGGSVSVQSEAILATAPMVLLAGGKIGALSDLNEVFVMNIAGGKPGGTTQYRNYEFNSVAKIGGRYYGADADGLYLLEGNDDDGKPIAAGFGLGQLDFGSPQLKTVAYCYLGTAAGGLSLNLQALVRGVPVGYDYLARGHGATMREVRFDLGKGLRSTYVMPTFYNIDGDRFEVDTIRFLVAESTRRI